MKGNWQSNFQLVLLPEFFFEFYRAAGIRSFCKKFLKYPQKLPSIDAYNAMYLKGTTKCFQSSYADYIDFMSQTNWEDDAVVTGSKFLKSFLESKSTGLFQF